MNEISSFHCTLTHSLLWCHEKSLACKSPALASHKGFLFEKPSEASDLTCSKLQVEGNSNSIGSSSSGSCSSASNRCSSSNSLLLCVNIDHC